MALSLWGVIKGLLVQQETDRTKQLSVEVSASATTNTRTTVQAAQTANRTVSLPDATDTLVGKATTDTLTNKTIDADGTGNVISNIDDGNIKALAGIDATKIGDGSVSNAEFQALGGVSGTVVDTSSTQTLSNKTLDNTNIITIQDTNLTVQDNVDNTKQVKLQLSGLTTGTTRTLTVPDADATLVGTDTTQTLSNKTLDNTTVLNVKEGNFIIEDTADATKQIKFEAGGTSGTSTTIIASQSSNRNITLPNQSDTLVGRVTSDTGAGRLQNKDFDALLTQFVDNSDTTKSLKVTVSGNGTGLSHTIAAGATGSSKVFSLPNATTTAVGTDVAQVLTNKTIDADSNTITNIENADIKALAGIDATKIADGSVSNTEFQYLDGATSNLQTQINAVTAGGSGPESKFNYSLTATVAANALTIALKTQAGADPSGASPVTFSFRNPTASVADYTQVSAIAATSVVIPSTTTIGTASGKQEALYVYALNNAGTIVLAVSLTPFGEGFVQSTSAISGGTSATTLYTTSAQTSKAIRFLGVLWSTQTTAGTWATAPAQNNLLISPRLTLGSQQIFTASGTWTRPSGCRAVRITVVGGGGGSGGNDGTNASEVSNTGGGGAGATAYRFISFGLGATETVTVGAGGTAGASGNNNAGNGGTSSFGSFVSCTGGVGSDGQAGTTAVGPTTITQAGGTATGGDINISGEYGQPALRFNGTAVSSGGYGGRSTHGPGGGATRVSGGTAAALAPAGGYGGGAGGGTSAQVATNIAGAAGAPGIVIVEEFF